MSDSSFFSSNRYLFLPTKNNPKVALSVDDAILAQNSFKLYNPFSSKAKIFKNLSRFAFVSLNIFSRFFGLQKSKSEFIIHLEKLLNQPVVASIYFATAKDKVVLQLQSKDAKILGYLKYPLNENGEIHIKNEIKAIEILSSKGIVDSFILSDRFDKKEFVLLQDLNGEIGGVEKRFLEIILKSFSREKSYELGEHPRILELKNSLLKYGLDIYLQRLDAICEVTKKEYKLVYEHGDFTPWNIVKVDGKYIPFDFEYFVENGLEHLDMIKYYYQVGKLLEAKKGEELYRFLEKELSIDGLKELFMVFLIKEIVRQKVENESFEFEENMFKVMEGI